MHNKYLILLTVCVGTILTTYVSSCVNIALPNIMAALNFNMDSIVWVSLSYMLPYGSILPLTGKLGDEYGAKNVYITGLILFTISSTLCGIANSSTSMIIFRIFQGIGAGMLLPNAMTLVTEAFSPEERGQALGIWGAMAAAGGAMGPTIGGYLIEHFAWRSIFISVVPLCIISMILAFLVLPKSMKRESGTIDWLGAALLSTAISALLVALNQGQKEGWDSLYIISFFYLAFASFVLFVAVEFFVESPMIPMSLFKSWNFSLANLIGFVSFLSFYGGLFLLPFFMKSVLGYSSITAGLVVLPLTLSMVISAPLVGRLCDRIGSRWPALIGMIMIGISFYSLRTVNDHYGFGDFFYRLTLFGIGLGFTMSPLSNLAIGALPKDKIGVGSGIFNLAKIVGGSVGVVFAQTLLSRREVYHTAVIKEYLNGATGAPLEIFNRIQSLWGSSGMNRSEIGDATMGWTSGYGYLPQQYAGFKAILLKLITLKSTVLAFEDVFFGIAMLCLLGGILCFFIRPQGYRMKKAS